jgi:hypothetical protein
MSPLTLREQTHPTSFQIADWIFRYDELHHKRPKKPAKQFLKPRDQARDPQHTFYMHKRREFLDPRYVPKQHFATSALLPEAQMLPKASGRRLMPHPTHHRSESMRETRLTKLLAWCESGRSELAKLEAVEKAEKESLARWKHLQRLHKRMGSYEPALVGEMYLQHLEIEDLYENLLGKSS